MSKIDSIKVFATQAECEANKPADAGKKKMYCVISPDGTQRWLWSDGYAQAIYQVTTKLLGWKVSVASEAKAITPEAALATLKATMTEEQLRVLLGLAPAAQPANPAPVVTPPAEPNSRSRGNNRSTQPA